MPKVIITDFITGPPDPERGILGHLAGACLDVLEHESPHGGSPLIKAWRDPAHPAHDRLVINPPIPCHAPSTTSA